MTLQVTNLTNTSSVLSPSSICTPEQKGHVHASLQSADSRLQKLALSTLSGDPFDWKLSGTRLMQQCTQALP